MERLSMKTRKELTQKVCQHYQMAGKKEKTVILTEFVHASGKLLAPIIKSSISHLSDYDESILSALKTISAATLDRILAVELKMFKH